MIHLNEVDNIVDLNIFVVSPEVEESASCVWNASFDSKVLRTIYNMRAKISNDSKSHESFMPEVKSTFPSMSFCFKSNRTSPDESYSGLSM